MYFRQCPPYADPITWFLTDEPKGHSLHFNSALVILGRSIGIPARLVGGYIIKGNEGTSIVLPYQRRAYVEVEFEGLGWVTFDATPEPTFITPKKVEPERFTFPPILLLVLAAAMIIVALSLLRSLNWGVRAKPEHEIESIDAERIDERLLIEFPQIGPDFPHVYGFNEPLQVSITVRVMPTPASGPSLTVDGNQYHLPSLTDGNTTTIIKYLSKGYHDFEASIDIESESVRSCVRLKIVDYREEVVELFNDMFAKQRTANTKIEDALTAREFSSLLRSEYPDLPEVALSRVASIFEFSDYSLRSIGRSDYERFYLASRELELILSNERDKD
jgi:hypothetical protein